jgi:S-adenosyl methyltransferase
MTDDMPGTGIDTTVPHSARIWNYWLGGKDNYAVDRAAGDEYAQVFPGIRQVAQAQRAFLARSITYLVEEAGIRQFLDVGTGLPTADNTHQVAQRAVPAARVVYVDNDPLVLAHARALLTSTPEGATAFIEADLRDIGKIMSEAARTLDFRQPVAVILHGILGHVVDLGQARALVRELMGHLVPGSYLDLADGARSAGEFDQAQKGYNDSGAVPYVLRSPEEIASFFDGLELVPPGVVPCPQWRPSSAQGDRPAETDMSSGVALGGVARKP